MVVKSLLKVLWSARVRVSHCFSNALADTPREPSEGFFCMHYYQFNIGDYRKDTAHLTPLEHGIYRMLLDTYYLQESPLSPDKNYLMRTHCVRSADEVQAFENVLADFFEETEEGFKNRGCEKQIARIYEKSEKARQAAEKRWNEKSSKNNKKDTPKSGSNADAMRTHSEGNAGGMLPKDPETQGPNNNTPCSPPRGTKTKRDDQLDFSKWPELPSDQIWKDWLKHRKTLKTTVSQSVINRMASELGQAYQQGYSVDYCLEVQVEAGWRGFKFHWLLNREANHGQSGQFPTQQRPGGGGAVARGEAAIEEAFRRRESVYQGHAERVDEDEVVGGPDPGNDGLLDSGTG